MKKTCFLTLFFAFLYANNIFAQKQNIPTESATFVYYRSMEAFYNKGWDKTILPNRQPSEIPDNFTDTLRKYDWAVLDSYDYGDKKFITDLMPIPNNFAITRYLPNGEQERYYANKPRENSPPELVFMSRSHVKNTKVQKVGQFHYITNIEDGATTYARIISYKDGLLVYDVTMSGSLQDINDPTFRFRRVCMAIPKKF